MTTTPDQLPDDVDALKVALIEARAKLSGAQAMIEQLRLMIDKLKREKFGPRSERSRRLLEQMELQLEELTAAAAEDETKAEAEKVQVKSFTRQKVARRNFPDHLPRQRVVHPESHVDGQGTAAAGPLQRYCRIPSESSAEECAAAANE